MARINFGTPIVFTEESEGHYITKISVSCMNSDITEMQEDEVLDVSLAKLHTFPNEVDPLDHACIVTQLVLEAVLKKIQNNLELEDEKGNV